MKLPFLLNSIARASSASDIERVFSKLLRVLPQLDGSQVSNALNLLSKKEVEPPVESWKHASILLLGNGLPKIPNGESVSQRTTHLHRNGEVEPNLKTAAGSSMVVKWANSYNPNRSRDTNVESVGCVDRGGIPSVLSSYSIRDAIIILNAFSKVDIMPPKLMSTVIDIVMKSFNKLDPHELSTVVHALGKYGMVDEVDALLKNNQDIIDKGTMHECDYSMILRFLFLNRDKLKETRVFDRLVGMIDSKCDAMSDKSMAILVNSLGRCGTDEKEILPLLTPVIVKRLGNGAFNAMCISQIANGVARLNHLDHDLMSAISRRTCDDLNQFNTRCKVTVMNAFHKLGHFNSELFSVLVTNLTSSHEDMTPQCIANTISAVSHFSNRIPRVGVVALFKALCHQLSQIQSLQQFTMQNQVNILNGLSKVGIHDDEVYGRLGNNIMQATQHLKPIDVACILNAFARARMAHAVVTYLCEQIGTYITDMKAQELSCCFNAVNNIRNHESCSEDKSGHSTWVSAVNVMANHLTRNPEIISRFRPLDTRLTIVSLAGCGILDHALYARLLGHLEGNLRRASMWDLVSIFSALVKVGYVIDTSLLDAIERSLSHIGICKDRGRDDMAALRLSIEHMGLQHPLSSKLACYIEAN